MKQKLRALFLFSFFSSFFFATNAQNHFDDSLKQVWQQRDLPDTVRISAYIQLGMDLQYGNPNYAKAVYADVCRLAHKTNDRYNMARGLSGLGNVYYALGEYDSALHYFHWAEALFQTGHSNEFVESVVTTKAEIANVELVHNNYEGAIAKYFEAIKMMEKSHGSDKWKALGNLYASVATVYHDMDQDDKALVYDLKGLTCHQKAKDNELLTAYLELYVAEDCLLLKKFQQSSQHLASAKSLVQKVNTADLYQKLYQVWGQWYQKSASPDSAILYFQKALVYAKKTGRPFTIMDNLRMVGFACRDAKNYKASESYFTAALAKARQLSNKRLQSELLKNLGLVTAAENKNKESVGFYQQYIVLNDSLKQAEVKKKINEIEAKYKASKMKDSVSLMQKDLLLKSADLHKKNMQNLGLLSGCTMLLLVSGLFYKNFKNKNDLLKQREELHCRTVNAMEKEKQLMIMQAILKGQEEERSRLARDLHDGVGGLLSGVKFSLATMKGNVFISEENALAFNQALSQLDQSITELRHVSHNMMPESLLKYGLAETLENYCSTLNLSKTAKVHLQIYGLQQRLEQSTEIVLYRIIQELITNSVRHGAAQNILLQLIQEDEKFSLTVEDDGKGFDLSVAERQAGAGLANIRSRVAYLNGTMDIRSIPGEGTSVYIEGNCS